jgi:hypothetical protein
MADASNGLIEYESSAAGVTNELLTDSGDHTVFTAAYDQFSAADTDPEVKPNGIITGVNLIAPTTNNDEITVAAFTAYFAGVEVSVSADTLTITRDASLDYQKFSIICNSSGTLSVIESDAHASAFSNTRGAAGGPPSIPLAEIEIGQIWVTDNTAAVITEAEIKESASNNQQERYDYPVFEVNNMGQGNKATDADKTNAYVEFASALPMIHGATANAAATAYKPVYADYETPTYVPIQKAVDFVPAETSTSVSSTPIYGGAIGSSSDSIGACTFIAYLTDGITDNLIAQDGKVILVKFYPDRNKAPYILTQGKLRAPRTYPADAPISSSVTLAATQASVNFDS